MTSSQLSGVVFIEREKKNRKIRKILPTKTIMDITGITKKRAKNTKERQSCRSFTALLAYSKQKNTPNISGAFELASTESINDVSSRQANRRKRKRVD